MWLRFIFISMKKKVIITESQLKKIVASINENEQHTTLVKRIFSDLKTNYEPALGSFNDGGEYQHKTLITKKVDGEQISLGALKNYLSNKYLKINDEFIEQVITDWYNGVLDGKNFQLTKNVNFI